METCLDRKRGGRLMTEVNDEHGTMTVCVGSGDEWREAGKMGLRAQRLAYISFRPPWLLHPNFFFFLPLNGLFSPVCPMNYVNDYGLPFSPRGRKDRSERNASSSLFSVPYAASEQPFMLALWACVAALWPCETMMVAAELVEGEGQGTMTYMRDWGGRQGENAGLVVGKPDID